MASEISELRENNDTLQEIQTTLETNEQHLHDEIEQLKLENMKQQDTLSKKIEESTLAMEQ